MASQRQAANVRAIAKAGEPDRYLAALLAKPGRRDDLIALAAFGSELARIPTTVHEPMMRDIRYQWWRDALSTDGSPRSQSGHPVADAMVRAIRTHNLPLQIIEDIIDAWDCVDDHDDEGDNVRRPAPEPTSSTALFYLAALICGGRQTEALRMIASDAGKAYCIARSLLKPNTIAPYREPVDIGSAQAPPSNVERQKTACLEHLSAARAAVKSLPRALRLAYLPLAVVEPYLQVAQENFDGRPSVPRDITPLSRIWRIWWSYCTARP